jgi:hypothetical protein
MMTKIEASRASCLERRYRGPGLVYPTKVNVSVGNYGCGQRACEDLVTSRSRLRSPQAARNSGTGNRQRNGSANIAEWLMQLSWHPTCACARSAPPTGCLWLAMRCGPSPTTRFARNLSGSWRTLDVQPRPAHGKIAETALMTTSRHELAICSGGSESVVVASPHYSRSFLPGTRRRPAGRPIGQIPARQARAQPSVEGCWLPAIPGRWSASHAANVSLTASAARSPHTRRRGGRWAPHAAQ